MLLLPDLGPWEMPDRVVRGRPVLIINGRKGAKGGADADIFSSREIVANPAAGVPGSEELRGLREEMGGGVVG